MRPSSLSTRGLAEIRGKGSLHQLHVARLQGRKLLPVHLGRDSDAAKEIGGDAAHIHHRARRIDHINAVIERKATQRRCALQLSAHAHLLQPDDGLAKVTIAAALALMRDHVCLYEHGADHPVVLIMDGEDVLDDRRAVAEHFALTTAAAAAFERLHQQRLLFRI